jgi:hypothetical protein
VDVIPDTGILARLTENPVVLIVIGAIVVGAGYLMYRRQKSL